MAKIDVSVATDLAPQPAWKLASDLGRFGEWLTIFGGWRSEVPTTIEEGTCVSSCIKVHRSVSQVPTFDRASRVARWDSRS